MSTQRHDDETDDQALEDALDAIARGDRPDPDKLGPIDARIATGLWAMGQDAGKTKSVPTAAERARFLAELANTPQIAPPTAPAGAVSASEPGSTSPDVARPASSSPFAGIEIESIRDANTRYFPLSRDDLERVPGLVFTVAQALDDQWLPLTLQNKLHAGALDIRDPHDRHQLQAQLNQAVSREFRRALLMAHVVVVNRGFLYGNEAVFRLFAEDAEDRDAFRTLLRTGIVVPFLVDERSPLAPPAAFVPHPGGFDIWRSLLEGENLFALRLSWDDALNKRDARQLLSRRFTEFVQNMPGRVIDFAGSLEVPQETRLEFLQRLDDAATATSQEVKAKNRELLLRGESSDSATIGRAFVYERLITEDKPHKRLYRSTDPAAFYLKSLVDLAYNSYLSDALGGYLLSPQDSPPRSALHELQYALTRRQQGEIDEAEIAALFQRAAFERVARRTEPYLSSIGKLSLDNILELRETPQWLIYIQRLDALLNDPLREGGLTEVVTSYEALAKEMTRTALRYGRTSVDELDPWHAEPVIETRTGSVRIVARRSDTDVVFWVEEIGQATQGRGVPVATTLTIGDRGNELGDLDARVELVSGTVKSPDLAEVVKLLRSSGFKQVYHAAEATREAGVQEPTVTAP